MSPNKKQQQIINAPFERMSFHYAAYLMTLSAALSYEHLHTANRLLIQGGRKVGNCILTRTLTQGQLQEWTENSHTALIFENHFNILKVV